MNSPRRSSATNYYSEKFRENAGDMKGTWQTMNDVLKGERKNCRIDEILVEGKRVTEPKHIANEFSKIFQRLGH